jgi:hypothetical protein
MSQSPESRPPRLQVRKLGPEVQGFLFTLDGDDEPLPGLESFFPEAPVVPVDDVVDLSFERSRRRFTQGA